MSTDWRYKKKSLKNKFWNLSIWNKLDQTMVREVDTVWNRLAPSLRRMHEKLANLGVMLITGEVVYLSREEMRNVWL